MEVVCAYAHPEYPSKAVIKRPMQVVSPSSTNYQGTLMFFFFLKSGEAEDTLGEVCCWGFSAVCVFYKIITEYESQDPIDEFANADLTGEAWFIYWPSVIST